MLASSNPQAEKKGSLYVTGDLEVRGQSSRGAVVTLTPGAHVVVDASLGNIFVLTPGEDTALTLINQIAGQRITIIVLTTSSSRTLTFGSGFKSQGTLASGSTASRSFTIAFESDGTNAHENGRSTVLN